MGVATGRRAEVDSAVHDKAARDWCDWEEAILPTSPGPSPRFERPEYRPAFARIVTHYWRHDHRLEDGFVRTRLDEWAYNQSSIGGPPAHRVPNLTGQYN